MRDPIEAFRDELRAVLGSSTAIPEVIEPGRWHRFSTNGKPGDTAGWAYLFADARGGVYGCHRQGVSETWSAFDPAKMPRAQRAELARQVVAATAEREARQRRQWADNAQRIARVWGQCVPLIPDDPCALYLRRRGLGGVWPPPEALRFHRALPYWHEGEKLGTFAAMVAPIVASDGRMVALHRTYLTAEGHKAPVPSVRKVTTAAGPLPGACIPLHRPARGCVGIAEGIETALAASCASTLPTVAAYSAGNLAAWRWQPGVERLVIFADHDKAGCEAAHTLRARAIAAHLRCEVMTPTEPGADWCDVWAQRGAVEMRK